jgi:signal transduction histidine kinase
MERQSGVLIRKQMASSPLDMRSWLNLLLPAKVLRPIMRSMIWLGFLGAAFCNSAFATQPDRTIAQYAHTTWGEKDGAPNVIWAMAQTTDGYLWLAAHDGLYRFDGVAFENYIPDGGTDALLALPNGDLWIGYTDGLIRLLRNGKVTGYDGAIIGDVRSLTQDREGTIWAATTQGLERLEGERWKAVDKDWNFPREPTDAAFVDRQGTLWVPTEDTLFFLPAGARRFQPIGFQAGSVTAIAQAASGKLWMSEYSAGSVRPIPLSDKRLPSDEAAVKVESEAILFDDDGGLWMAGFGSGLHHAPAPDLLKGEIGKFSTAVESFTARDGLSDDNVRSVLQDREGHIWVGTNGGLDRFRKTNLVPVVSTSKLNHVLSVLGTGDDGDAWLGNDQSIVRIHEGRYADRHLLPGRVISALRDSAGTTRWICVNGIYSYHAGSYSRIPLPASFPKGFGELFAVAATSNSSGALWLAARREGLFYWKQGKWQQIDIAQDLVLSLPEAAYTDWMGRAWIAYGQGEIIVIDQANIWKTFPLNNSLVSGVLAVNGRGRHIWIGGTAGAAFFDGNRFHLIIPEDAERFKSVMGVEETRDGSLWLAEDRGVIQIPASEVRHFLDNPSYRVKYRLFDSYDGLTSKFVGVLTNPREIQGTDGKLWFAASRGVVGIDPAHLSTNTVPPPVFIRSVSVSGMPSRSPQNLTLPARTTNLQISYTALSLSGSDKVRFRYILEGVDKGWQDAGTRREAFYTGLGPGKHHFRVIACNNDGAWNEVGARLDFAIAPAWFQTISFRVFCAGLFLLMLWALYQLRLKQLERQFNVTLQTRVDERTRIARELHDTMLQSFQGLLLRFQTVSNLLPARPEEAKTRIDNVIDEGSHAITEGRDAVHELRSAGLATVDLAESIRNFAKELLGNSSERFVEFHAQLEGTPRDLNPVVRDEVYRIAAEALRNAIRHAEAQRIEVEIRYNPEHLQLRIRDDGKGIDAGVLDKEHVPGHWGLRGMRERAKLIGGTFEIWSETGSGTEIELKIPAVSAYAKRSASLRSFFSRS